MNYIENEIIPTRRWFDYETFVSCSPKPFDFYDPYTQQFPENNLGKFQAGYAYLELYRATRDQHYLDIGQLVVDYSSLQQQVWSHVLLTPHLLGGYTTQNTDGEWSDARQGYAAEMLLDYYKETGNFEYLERGIAALRSSFSVAPFENWSHEGGGTGDQPGSLSGFHWCQGSGMTSVEITYPWLRDSYINVKRQHGVGVNGCSLTNLVFTSNSVSLTLVSPFKWVEPMVIVIDAAAQPMQVIINGKKFGNFYCSTTC